MAVAHGGRADALTLAALLLLTGLSFAASYAPLGALEIPVAMAIAVLKVTLVALIFMHLTRHEVTDALAVGAALTLVAALLVFIALDVGLRARPPLRPAESSAPDR